MNKEIKVSSTSNSGSVAGMIAYLMKNEKVKQVELAVIGAGAVSQAIKAIAIATGFLAPVGINIVCRPIFINTTIKGEKISGIKLIVREEIK